jgi:hypothetical protein
MKTLVLLEHRNHVRTTFEMIKTKENLGRRVCCDVETKF